MLVGHGPAHEREVVEHRLGQVAGPAVEVQAHRILALRDLRAVGVAQQRQVAEDGLRPPEAVVEDDVLGERREPLLRPDHVGDPHQVVVDDVRQVVRREAVALQQDLVVDLRVVEPDLAPQQVVDDRLARGRHREPDDAALAGRAPPRRLGPVDRAAPPVVAEVQLLRLLLLAESLEPLAGAEARVGGAALDEEVGVLPVDLRALALAVGAVRAADVRTLVPAQAQPPQGVEDHRLAGEGAALAVGVLDPEDELPAVPAGEGVVEERHVRGSDVGISGGARGDARPDRHGNW